MLFDCQRWGKSTKFYVLLLSNAFEQRAPIHELNHEWSSNFLDENAK